MQLKGIIFKLSLTLFIVLSSAHKNFSQNQLGSSLTGKVFAEKSGVSIDLNNNGSILAIGAPLNNDIQYNAGRVGVFERINGAWMQMGQDIYTDTLDSRLGSSLVLSASGKTLVIGAPRHYTTLVWQGKVEIFDYNGVSWIKRGSSIEGSNMFAYLGQDVDISSDGNIIIVSAHDDVNASGVKTGSASVFEWDGTTWIAKGNKLFGGGSGFRFGYSVNMDSSGNKVAVSEPDYSFGNNLNVGRVRTYEWNGAAWVQLGADIIGDSSNSEFGNDIKLSSNGNILAIGSPSYEVNGVSKGLVKVYEWNGSSWNQKGNSMIGRKLRGFWGNQVDLSHDGNLLLSGSFVNGTNLSDPGYAQAYEYVNGSWVTKGSEIVGLDSTDQFGWSVTLDSSGNTAAIGAPESDDNFVDAGHVRVFDLSGTVSLQEKKLQSVTTISPNPFTNDFVVSFKQVESGTMRLIDTNGKVVQLQTFNNNRQVRVEYQGSAGQYFLELELDNKIRETYKIIKL